LKTSGGSVKCKIKGTIIHFHGDLMSDIEKANVRAIQKELCLDMVMKNILPLKLTVEMRIFNQRINS
jgi:hypothetical protein